MSDAKNWKNERTRKIIKEAPKFMCQDKTSQLTITNNVQPYKRHRI